MIEPLQTVLEINLKYLTNNYQYLRSKVASGVKMLAVVKAFGYGSDAVVVAKHLEKIGVDYLAVAYVPEGVTLRKAGITIPILVLYPQPANFEMLISNKLEPSLYSLRVFELFLDCAKSQGQQHFPIHLKYNSGLNRIGFHQKDTAFLTAQLQTNTAIQLTSMLSHLSASEDLEQRAFTGQEMERFKKFSATIIDAIGYTPLLHQSNTSGILNYPETHLSMVRTGIGLYGFGNDARFDKALRPIASLKSVISQIHELQVGDGVGYNRAFVARENIKIATIPLGHADGIGRQYGLGKGFVTVHGKRAPILGNVCMDMIMVDVTTLRCVEGDEVIIFDENHSADTLAEAAGTISYELITGISSRVKRHVIED